jgi:prophage antirepressor-like protein
MFLCAVFLLPATLKAENNRLPILGCCTKTSVTVPCKDKKGSLSLFSKFNKNFSSMQGTMKNASGAKDSNTQAREYASESGISVFNFEGDFGIRVDTNNGNPLFCLADVCHVLGISNPSYVKNRLNSKGVFLKYTLTKGGKQSLIFVSEGNLYRVVFRSDKPNARKFEDWVTDEVLPSIRKTGVYSIPKAEDRLSGQSVHITGADDNLYVLSIFKAFREFMCEEISGNIFTEKRLIKKIDAARTLFREDEIRLRNINVKCS